MEEEIGLAREKTHMGIFSIKERLSRYYDEAIRSGAADLVSKEIGNGLVDKCMKLLEN